MHRVGFAVGHDHLRARRAVQHGPAVEAHVVQDEALLRVDRGAQRPAVPADRVALDGEADALGLRDLDRPQVVARGDGTRGVGAVRVRNRLDVELLELEHAALVDVHVRDQALDRMRIAVVAGVRAQVGDGARDAPAALDGEAEAARGEHVDLHERDVVDTAPPQRLAPARVGAHRLGGGLVVLGRDRRARDRAGRAARRPSRRRGRRRARCTRRSRSTTIASARRAGRGPPSSHARYSALDGSCEADRDEARVVEPAARERGRALELAGRERLERVGGACWVAMRRR